MAPALPTFDKLLRSRLAWTFPRFFTGAELSSHKSLSQSRGTVTSNDSLRRSNDIFCGSNEWLPRSNRPMGRSNGGTRGSSGLMIGSTVGLGGSNDSVPFSTHPMTGSNARSGLSRDGTRQSNDLSPSSNHFAGRRVRIISAAGGAFSFIGN